MLYNNTKVINTNGKAISEFGKKESLTLLLELIILQMISYKL